MGQACCAGSHTGQRSWSRQQQAPWHHLDEPRLLRQASCPVLAAFSGHLHFDETAPAASACSEQTAASCMAVSPVI